MNRNPKRTNKPFDGKTSIRYDDSRVFNKVIFTVDGDDLKVHFCTTYAPKRMNHDFIIPDFKNYTALEVLNNLSKFNNVPNTTIINELSWGNHWTDGVHEIWKYYDIPLGYVIPILRPLWNRKSIIGIRQPIVAN